MCEPLQKIRSCTRSMVLMDGGGGERGNFTLAFHHVHGDGKDTYQDAPPCFVDTRLIITVTCNNRDMTWVVVFALELDMLH